jgi:pimeloyl-ACP methyl ester carboxylesterase
MHVSRLGISILSVLVASAAMMPGPVRAAGPQGTVYQFSLPKQGSMYADPTYYCWLPDNVGAVRAIIVHQHGCTREGDAQQMMGDVQWLTLAKKWHAAFIAPKLITGGPSDGSTKCNNWDNINNGSGNTFLAALDSLARRSSHPEIKTVPWALWGHSGGSMWITAMTGKYPERVAVGVAQACATEISNVPAALQVPILHHNGLKDMCYNDAYFENGRKKGALWAHAVNPHPLWVNTPSNPGWSDEVFGHAPHDLRMIAIPWLDIGLTARLPDQPGANQLKPMDTSNAWLGDTATRAIASEASFTGNKSLANWFPNQMFAELWKEYMATGAIKDTTPPPAPYALAGNYSNRQINLTWNSDADLQGGIKTFIIYRDGAILTTLTYTTTTLFTSAKGYQRWEDGDNPDPTPAPAMTFTDNNLSDTATYTYQISTVNWSDVAGPKSNPLVLKRGTVVGLAGSATAKSGTGPREFLIVCGEGAACTVDLAPGRVGFYDARGTLIRKVDVRQPGKADVRALLGLSAPRWLLIRIAQP